MKQVLCEEIIAPKAVSLIPLVRFPAFIGLIAIGSLLPKVQSRPRVWPR